MIACGCTSTGSASRLLRCGVCGKRCREVHDIRKQRAWRDSVDAEAALETALPSAPVRAGWSVPAAGCGWRSFHGRSRGPE